MSELAAGAVAPRSLWRHPAFAWTLVAAALGALAILAAWDGVAAWLLDVEFGLARILPEGTIAGAAWFVLPALAVGAGLLASLSPCVLPLVPLNVALIGASEARGWQAAARSGRFVLGAALALSVLGLFADLAGLLLIEQRGPVFLLAGGLMVYLALAFLDLAPLPLAGRSVGGAGRLGPVAAGAAFALLTTPCASPLLAALLAAAAAQGVPGLSATTMLAFSLGYTALVFAAGVLGGGLVGALRRRSFEAPRAAAAALLLVAGLGFGLSGALWF